MHVSSLVKYSSHSATPILSPEDAVEVFSGLDVVRSPAGAFELFTVLDVAEEDVVVAVFDESPELAD
jgi:hypothetical protein